MTDRLADIAARIAGIEQLGAVVKAMRGIAAARVQQARGQLEAVDQYATTIAAAIGRALALVPDLLPDGPLDGRYRSGRPAIVVFCAEQGFAGAFSERVLDSLGTGLAEAKLFLIGTRGAVAAAERGITARWKSAMPSHSPGIPKLADAIAEALYQGIAQGEIDSLDAVFTHGHSVEHRRLFPLDMARFTQPSASPPLVNLPPAALLDELTADYLHAQLCAAALHAFAAENQARMEAMAAAQSQIERQLAALQATHRIVRQQEITEEIVELAAGEVASRNTMTSRQVRNCTPPR